MRYGAEHTAYRAGEVARVAAVLAAHAGPGRAATEQELAREAGMGERRFRAVLADFDGTPGRWLVGKVNRTKDGPGGVYLARSAEEAAALDAELRAKHATLAARLGRRAAYWAPGQARMDFGRVA